jgi:hypothetical protein
MLFEKKTNLLFLLRELVCVFIARTQGKKKNSFYCTNLWIVLWRETRKKKIIFTARTRVFLLRELNQKKKIFFSLQLVGSLAYRQQEKKMFFLLHELDQKLVRKYYHIYVREKNWHFVLCEKKKFILLQEFNETASCSYCANSIFFFKMHELYPKLVKFIFSTSITDIKKKKPFFLLRELNQKKKKNLLTARTRGWSHKHTTRKKNVFSLHELDQKLVRKYYHIYVREKNWHFVLCEKKKKSFYCKNSMKLRRVHTARTRFFFAKCMNCIQSLSNSHSAHQLQTSKKRNLFDCANSQNTFYCRNSIKSSYMILTARNS